MSTYLITGCSRGLGLAFVKELVAQGPTTATLVLATSRSAQPPPDLQTVIDTAPNQVKHISLDVTDPTSIASAVTQASTILGPSGLDILINNAGITNPDPGRTQGMTTSNLTHLFTTNVVAVHAVTQALLPLLRLGTAKKLINISSTMGSMGTTLKHADTFKSIPNPSYNISKAALNSLTVQYAIDLTDQGFTVLAISPGHLQTELGGKGAPLTVDVGAKATLDIVQKSGVEDSGKFRNIYVEGDFMHNGLDPEW